MGMYYFKFDLCFDFLTPDQKPILIEINENTKSTVARLYANEFGFIVEESQLHIPVDKEKVAEIFGRHNCISDTWDVYDILNSLGYDMNDKEEITEELIQKASKFVFYLKEKYDTDCGINNPFINEEWEEFQDGIL